MKRDVKVGAILLPFLTLLLIISGAAMPFTVARLQDLQTERITDIRQFSQVNLTLQQNSSVAHVLQLINSADFSLLDYSGSTNLTSDKVIDILHKTIKDMSDNGLINNPDYSTDQDWDLRLNLMAQADNSAIVWLCQFYNTNNNYFAIIDDTSAKIVRLMGNSPLIRIEPMEQGKLFISTQALDEQGDTFMLVNDIDYQQKIVMVDGQTTYEYVVPESIYETDSFTEDNFPPLIKWRNFCEDYYNIKIEEVEKYYFRDYIQYIMKYRLDEQDVWYTIPIAIYSDYTIF